MKSNTSPLRLVRQFAVNVVLMASFACGNAATTSDGPPMPDFDLATLEGSTVTKASLAGRIVVYDFWATWCGPCHLQADILREALPMIQAKGAEIVGIATGEDPQVVRDFAARRSFPWRVLLDSEETLSNQLEVLGLPTIVVTDRSGRITFRQTGIVDPAQLERELTKAGAG